MTEPDAQEAAVLAALAAEDLVIYAKIQRPGFESPWHVAELAHALEDVAAGKLKRLIVQMPPRHGKSETSSVLFPPFYLGRNPGHSIIAATYGQDLADDFGRAVRNHMLAENHAAIFPRSRLAGDSTAANRFATVTGGAYYAVGRGGPITGRGADLLLIDDALKDAEEASSETVRHKLHEWYRSVAYTRLMPDGAVVVIETPWHEDCLSQWLLREHGNEGWHVIKFPALAEADEKYRREGEPLWPSRYDAEALDRIRLQVGPAAWLSLYQQRPTLEGGYMFRREWLKFYKHEPDRSSVNCYLLVDPAHSKKKKSDSTAIGIVGLGQDRNYYLLDLVHDRLNLIERGDAVFALHRQWRPLAVGYEQYGLQADVEYLQDRMERENYRFTVTPLGGGLAKMERIRRHAAPFAAGHFWLPFELWKTDTFGLERDLVRTFIEQEFQTYPASRHDDILDMLARIYDEDLPKLWPTPESEPEKDRYTRKRRRYGEGDGGRSWMST